MSLHKDEMGLLCHEVTKKDKETLFNQLSMKWPLENATYELLKVGKQVTTHDILTICDQQPVSQLGFFQFRKTFNNGLKKLTHF